MASHQTIRQGSTGADVSLWQTFLKLPVDGNFGPATVTATKAWQSSHGLTADGVVGAATWAAAEGVGLKGGGGTTTAAPVNPQELPNQLTPLTADEAAKALAAGYKQVTGKAPTANVLKLLVAQSGLETGNWQSIHNYNFGNAKATGSDPYYTYFRCSEVINGVEQFFDPPSPQCKFAAHKTAADGAAHYISVLKNRENWWNGLQTGTPQGFVAGLTTAPKYFTADPTKYGNTLAELATQYEALAKKYAGNIVLGTVIGLIMLAIAGVVGYKIVKL